MSVSVSRDAAVTALDVPKYSLGRLKVKGTLLNYGITNLTTADVNYRIDQGTVHTSSLTGLNLTLGSTTDFAVADSVILTPGSYQLAVWVSNVNGAGPDLNPANDTMSMTVNVASAAVPRKPFYEEFTSSTCAPCANFNSTVFTPFLNTHGDEITLIKYQMSWPSPGDPYYTEEGGVRRYFYGVSFVPDLYVDGNQTATNSSGVNNGLTNSLDTPSFMDVLSHYSFPVNGLDTGVVINVELMPYVSGDLTLFAAVIEEVTYHNKMSNGETEFHHVMMKMVPDAYGTPVTLVDGVPQSLELTADLSNTNIERWTDLMVIVWVQDTLTREFFQSGYGDSINVGIRPIVGKDYLKLYPNPASSYVTINGISGIREVALIDNTGRTVLLRREGTLRKIDLENIPAGIYVVKVISDEGIKTAKLSIAH